ncbi:uncharacterized protein KY384_009199 [Bacidia gigantensis]|uniref:uncharacterized protein n=1 Tax=Bacidia gigantensis TaxID=2732470 RepID=UPI001D0589E0|nr:uncharacterized protein KY384_009199 [Bacidia gigantensis]KAG8525555.1 hypothetical protein KY384_009199 [Bacidia gigantensis]
MEPATFEADREEELALSFDLEEDAVRKEELSSSGSRGRSIIDQKYRIAEQQLLQEGKLGDTGISARIKRATFGVFNEQPACLVHVRLDFCPKNGRSFFRFRSAIITIEFEEVEDVVTSQDEVSKNLASDDDKKAYERPLVLRFYPELIRGHIQHTVQTHGIKLYAEPASIGVGAEIGGSRTFQREGKHIIHGRLIKAQQTVKWTINENEATKSGIYEQPSFAVIVRYGLERGFAMKLAMKATTYGGLSVKGKKSSRVVFKKPDKLMDSDLEKENLEELTNMKAELLGREGPGAGGGLQAEQDAILGE